MLERATIICYWWDCKLMHPLPKPVGTIDFQKTERKYAIWPSYTIPWHMPKRLTILHYKYCSPTLIAALFTIGKNRNNHSIMTG